MADDLQPVSPTALGGDGVFDRADNDFEDVLSKLSRLKSVL